MGTGPKSGQAQGEVSFAELKKARYEELENIVKDAIVSGVTDDGPLDFLISLAIQTAVDGVQAAKTLLEQPHFYTNYFVPWVKEGLEERHKINEIENDVRKKAGGSV